MYHRVFLEINARRDNLRTDPARTSHLWTRPTSRLLEVSVWRLGIGSWQHKENQRQDRRIMAPGPQGAEHERLFLVKASSCWLIPFGG
jgi:hypothetical protein